jgi:hypothetical protein
MRAQTVNFERGLDPKDSLEIGNKNAREFRKALREKDYFSPALQNMIIGLREKSVSEKDAIKFLDGAINKYDKDRGQTIIWYDWYHDSWNNAYWNTNYDKFIITIEMPDNEKLEMEQDRKVICEINETLSGDHGQMFQIRTYAHIKNDFGNFYEDHFEKENVFFPNDGAFNLLWTCRLINHVVETAIKELG